MYRNFINHESLGKYKVINNTPRTPQNIACIGFVRPLKLNGNFGNSMIDLKITSEDKNIHIQKPANNSVTKNY